MDRIEANQPENPVRCIVAIILRFKGEWISHDVERNVSNRSMETQRKKKKKKERRRKHFDKIV